MAVHIAASQLDIVHHLVKIITVLEEWKTSQESRESERDEINQWNTESQVFSVYAAAVLLSSSVCKTATNILQ